VTTPRVSIIVIFFNGAAFFDEAIESVLAQTFTDWELLLCDDGSTDESTAKADLWAARDPRIRRLEHEGHANRGMSATRNLGLTEARGEYVAFLDCDDVWLPEKLSAQVPILDADTTLDATYGSHRVWYSWTGVPADHLRDRVEKIGVEPGTTMEPGELFEVYTSDSGAVPAICAILARRTSLERVGGFETAFRDCFEDQVFYSKLGLHLRVHVTGTCDTLYRQHPESCCAVAIREGRFHPRVSNPTRRRYLEWLEAYLRDLDRDSGPSWQSLQAELDTYRRVFHPAAVRARLERFRAIHRPRVALTRAVCRALGIGPDPAEAAVLPAA
jgi:glycosyltransferase involved in cell wall biosynthesis